MAIHVCYFYWPIIFLRFGIYPNTINVIVSFSQTLKIERRQQALARKTWSGVHRSYCGNLSWASRDASAVILTGRPQTLVSGKEFNLLKKY